jgi:hypothetical protein
VRNVLTKEGGRKHEIGCGGVEVYNKGGEKDEIDGGQRGVTLTNVSFVGVAVLRLKQASIIGTELEVCTTRVDSNPSGTRSKTGALFLRQSL